MSTRHSIEAKKFRNFVIREKFNMLDVLWICALFILLLPRLQTSSSPAQCFLNVLLAIIVKVFSSVILCLSIVD